MSYIGRNGLFLQVIMKQHVIWGAIALMMAATMVACSGNDDTTPDEPLSNENNERRDISLTRTEQELVGENNAFAFNLFRKVAAEPKSAIVSPISITYAWGC